MNDITCADRCGFNCKTVAFEQATNEANDLVAKLGSGWKPDVWHNCGWNYAAAKGIARVHPQRRGSSVHGGWVVTGYSAYLNATGKQFIARAADPNDALGYAVQDARTTIERMKQEFGDLLD